MHAPVNLPLQQARGLEHPQVFGHRRQRNLEWLGKFRNRGLVLGQAAQDGPPRGVGQRAKRLVQGSR
jgi:hypothetical protein